jgi:biofilm PGA synthesis N-glycosyltransferase PgaC
MRLNVLNHFKSVKPAYALITPAKNEAAFIGWPLKSIIAQGMRPVRWVIVDDGSTDDTAQIAEQASREHPFISVLRISGAVRRNFSSKVEAFNAGLELLKGVQYQFIGNLDADISLDPSYYSNILKAFENDPRLGIAGGSVYTTIKNEFVCFDNTVDSVGGAVQLFRRECFEDIQGYRRLPYGGIDAAAEIVARSRGWNVRKVKERVYEHRQTGSTQGSVLSGRYKDGLKFQSLGYNALFFTGRCLYRILDRPVGVGSALSMLGFAYARWRGYPIYIPKETTAYLRSEQRNKMKHAFCKLFPFHHNMTGSDKNPERTHLAFSEGGQEPRPRRDEIVTDEQRE